MHIGGVVNESVDRAVVRVICAMYQRIGDELTVDDMARTAMYSKFHFSRAFREVTGVSPGRFLSALRFQEAKRLLASTSLSVAEISNRVGYSSLGTFSTRFKSSVGVTPTEYRRIGGRMAAGDPSSPAEADNPSISAMIRGQVSATGTDGGGPTFVGLFRDAVPHRAPIRFTLLASPGPYVLADVPDGTWYLLAHAAGAGAGGDLAGSVGQLGPVTVRPGATLDPVDLCLRPMRTVDLPVLPAPFVTRPPDVARSGNVATHGKV
jgi:AraC-like DNA-binding protein